ncbi:transmembrane protein 35B [Amia ocellicauda]|uniref:transmembrane protein 35B n=1 Tax=Amia ocellicauda TaxID=2972642 RepID=UPI0034640371
MAVLFTLLRVLLGLFFAVTGVVKLTDRISQDTYSLMCSQFVQFAEVFPLRVVGVGGGASAVPTGGRVGGAGGRPAVGRWGLADCRRLSNFILSIVMMVALFTLLKLQQPLAMCCPAALCLGLLLLLNFRGRGSRAKTE